MYSSTGRFSNTLSPGFAIASAFRLRSLRHRSLRHRSVHRSASQRNTSLRSGHRPSTVKLGLKSLICGGNMKIVAFIKEPPIIEEIRQSCKMCKGKRGNYRVFERLITKVVSVFENKILWNYIILRKSNYLSVQLVRKGDRGTLFCCYWTSVCRKWMVSKYFDV